MSANNDAGKILLTPKGEYSGVVTYEVLDTVYYVTSSVKGVYVAKGTTTGNLPTDTDYWKLLIDLSTFITTASTATLSDVGLVKPDGITDETNVAGLLTALGVAIAAEIDSTATAYGSSWLKVGQTTLAPDTRQLYRVTQSGREYLYYWTGTAYAKVAGAHIIENAAGTEFPMRSKLKLRGATVNDNAAQDATEVIFSGGGGGGSTITVTTPETTLQGQSVTLTDGTTTLTETFNNTGVAVFSGVTLTGNLTIESTDGDDTATTSISIPYFGNYNVSLTFWQATINVSVSTSALNGLTVYAKKEGRTLGYATISNAQATITVPETGTYSIECTLDWKKYTTTASVTEQTTYSATLTTFAATINLSTPTAEFMGEPISVTVDGTAITGTAFDNEGSATYTALQAGVYVFTLTYEGEPYTSTVTVTSETTYNAPQIKMWTATLSLSTTSAEFVSSTITIKKGGVTVGTTAFSSGAASFVVHEAGTYTCSVDYDGDTYSSTATVTEETSYPVVINLWTATIVVSTTASSWHGVTATLKKSGSTVGTTTFDNSGDATFVVHETGTYTVEVTDSGWTYSTSDIVVSAETEYADTLNPFNATLSFNTTSAELMSSTITITKGGTTVGTVSFASGAASYVVHEPGTYIGTCTYGGKDYSGTAVVTTESTYNVRINTVSIYGAEWDGTSTTAWSRTDAAAGFTDPVPYVAGATSYGSPFDNIMPWSGMVKSERTGGTMVAIPKFYYKITQNGAGMKIQITDGEVEGFSVSPAHMDRGDGLGERDVVYVGRYHSGSSGYKSTTGQTPYVNATRSEMRTALHNLDSKLSQIDFAMRFTLWLLYIVEFADWNSQAKIGYGCAPDGSTSAVRAMGYTDSMPYHTGTDQASRTTYGGTQYRNIEGLWDNCYDWLDGCYYNSNGLNIILNPDDFSDTAGGVLVGLPTSGYPSAFTVENVAGTYPLFIPTESNGSDSTCSCDYWYFNASSPCLYAGGSYSQSQDRGLFYVSGDSAASKYASRGCRLQELP